MPDKKEKKTVTTKDNSLFSPPPITKSDFMSALKKVSRRLTDVPSDHRPDKSEPKK